MRIVCVCVRTRVYFCVCRRSAWEGGLALLRVPELPVQFFAANMLCSKVRSSWLALDPALRNPIYSRLLAAVQDVLTGALVLLGEPVQNRLCAAVATAGCLGGDADCARFLQMALSLSSSQAAQPVVIELILALAQEAFLKPMSQAAAITHVVADQLPAIVRVLEAAAAAATGVDGKKVLTSTLTCARVWRLLA
jgi:hypothetical protein